MSQKTDPDMDEEELKPRPYQVQLEEIAMQRNTIIHLPTGSGKTYIAVRLISRFRKDLSKPFGAGGKRTFYLVNTVPLVDQQSKVIRLMCPVKSVGAYSSEDNVDYWNKSTWDGELRKNEVVVMTCQILSDMLQHDYIRLSEINLLIFDECHHAVDDHPMRQVMKHFENCPMHQKPRVLGLTATLLNANVTLRNVEDAIIKLETTFHATIATVNDLGEVLEYSTNPNEILLVYRDPECSNATAAVQQVLEDLKGIVLDIRLPGVQDVSPQELKPGQVDITRDPLKTIKAVKNMLADMQFLLETMGVFGGSLGILAYTIMLEQLKRKATTKEESTFYQIVITQVTLARKMLDIAMENDTGYSKIKKHSSDQILQLLNILGEYNPSRILDPEVMRVNKSRKPLSAIIFTQRRFTAKVLYNILKEVKQAAPDKFGFLKHEFVVGFNINPMKNTREQHYIKKCSQKALLKFSNKDLNCLISTNVIEEGVDIPQCLLVVKFDLPSEYRSYIQSKGRARSSESSFVMLMSDSAAPKFREKYEGYQRIEKYIQRLLVDSDNRAIPTDDQIKEDLYEDEDVEPYINPYTGGKLSATAAISLLNRYCSCLPHDQFTAITPMWISELVDTRRGQMQRVLITMPIGCPVKDTIQGVPKKNLKSAKRSAALNACIKLHETEELQQATMLPRVYAEVDFDHDAVKHCFPNWPLNEREESGLPKAGTKKRMRKHVKVYPSCLEGPQHTNCGKQKFYLHLVTLKMNFEKPIDNRELALYELLERPEGYGFLTYKKLPRLCGFPMFLTVGEVTVTIAENYDVVELDQDRFQQVKQFHHMLFDQVLEVAKKFVVHVNGPNTLYVVPVLPQQENTNIDWQIIDTYKSIPPYETPSPQERKDLNVTQDRYKYSVVTPWYRIDLLPNRYIVSNVLEYLTPHSPFDTDSYGSYQDYFNSKYSLEIQGPQDQPLLEVKNISSRMNCLLPRAATLKTLTDKQLKLIAYAEGENKPKGFQEILIPEYCIHYEFPGVLWYKAMMLPSLIHRVTMLLVAEELRSQIARETNIGCETLPRGEKWLPIQLNVNIATKSLLSQVEAPQEIRTIDRMNNPEDNTERQINIVSMKDNIYQLQKKKLSKQFPWDENKEPLDIERNLTTVTLMDVECYDEFVTAPLITPAEHGMNVRSPLRTTGAAALLPPPLTYNDKIELLTRPGAGRGAELRDVAAALTAINSHDMFDLERVETLGDSFLKFSASLYLYHKFPKLNEGQLTNIKGRLIGNRNLYYAGERINLGGKMKLEQFSPRSDFVVPSFAIPQEILTCIEQSQIRPTFLIGVQVSREEALSGRVGPDTLQRVHERRTDPDSGVEREPRDAPQFAMQCYVHKQVARDKTVADGVEALIGTYLVSSGFEGGVRLLEWLRVLPKEDNFMEYLTRSVPTALSLGKATRTDIDFILNHTQADVEAILGYQFKDPSLLLEALSHPSYIRNRLTHSYERLEFLGDALLDFLITAHIFEQHSQLKPGQLTDLRSALVNNVTFASYTVKLDLHKYICSQLNPVLDNAVITFVEHQTQRDHAIAEDVLYLIDELDCKIAEYVDVPKVLSDIFEALAGAIYLDSGGSLVTVWRVYYAIMQNELSLFAANVPRQPVRLLYENIHACPHFGNSQVVSKDVPRVMIPVTITKSGRQYTVHGYGGNKAQAKRAAAKLALKVLGP